MPVREFPALGFDPAPGEPASLDALGHDVARHARSLAAGSQRAATIRATGWVGQAADAFAADIAPLPGDLDRAADAFGMVTSALGAYAHELEAAQRHADTLEQRATQARAAITRTGKALLRPAGRAFGALAKAPFVVRLVHPVVSTIRRPAAPCPASPARSAPSSPHSGGGCAPTRPAQSGPIQRTATRRHAPAKRPARLHRRRQSSRISRRKPGPAKP
jgi:hypothetical protein